MKKIIFLAFLLISVNIFAQTERFAATLSKADYPKNIIILIGDGMGVTQVYTGYTALKGDMNITQMPVSGFSITKSESDYITDSGAGGTAIATGQKVPNHHIAMDKDGKPINSILEYASRNGLSTGMVVTCDVTHATPASFVAHNKNRSNYEEIALDYLKTDIDVFIGGGYKNFANRKDKVNLLDELVKKQYKVARSLSEINTKTDTKVAALLVDKHLPSMLEGRGDVLPQGTKIALEILKNNPKGFFMMVEGSQIDWACHSNNTKSVIAEMLDFDKAVGAALEFAKKDKNTLVIVTADHETGGMALTGGNFEKGELDAGFISNDHTATMVPVFAYGPGASIFTGVQENTELFQKCMHLLKLDASK